LAQVSQLNESLDPLPLRGFAAPAGDDAESASVVSDSPDDVGYFSVIPDGTLSSRIIPGGAQRREGDPDRPAANP
jgi:hypothetical protein